MAEDDELREQLRRLASEMEKLRDEIGGERRRWGRSGRWCSR